VTASASRAIRDVILAKGWVAGSDLEDRVCRLLGSARFTPSDVKQQHRAGRYRIDFAWLDVMVAMEVDGPRHLWDPATAVKDARRDAYLRDQGWLVCRVDAEAGPEGLAEQVVRVCRLVAALRSWL
jgi:very-short-patch-repair endonuclease